MVPVQITTEEKKILLEHYQKGQSRIISQRAHAVLLSFQGLSSYQISNILFHTEKTIREWIKAFVDRRISSVFPEYINNQNASKLTKEQKEEIKNVLSQVPSDYGIPGSFWAIKPLKTYIHVEFGVEYQSRESYRLIFKMCNYSFHLPEKFDIHRNQEQIKIRIDQIRQEIEPLLKHPDWEVLVSDETRIVWEALVRRAWLPKGRKSIIKTVRSKTAQNFIGFLNLKIGKPLLFSIPWQNQIQTIAILKKVIKKYPDKKICLIWDNATWHRGKLIKLNLSKGKPLSKFHLINLPPYAPDTNPQEKIWRYGKDKISNQNYTDFTTLVHDFQSIIMGRNYPYQIGKFVLG